jgi:hypothetical protein
MTNITFTNRKGTRYFLCVGKTKLGKIRYAFARDPGKTPVTSIPVGHEIRESINGVVSLAKARPILIRDTEADAVKSELGKHPKGSRYRVNVQPDSITIYEGTGPDLEALNGLLAARLGIPLLRVDAAITATADRHAQYMPMLRFLLISSDKRTFAALRMCFRSGVDGWIPVSASGKLSKLVNKLVPTLGTDAFYELF